MQSFEITPLERDKWQDYKLDFHYTSINYYDIEIGKYDSGFHVSFVKKPFAKPFEKPADNTDLLFQKWWEDIMSWGIAENGQLSAVIETAAETWSNRLRVTELWVSEKHRRKGVGRALMDIAVDRAKKENRRAIILETQSCNEAAINFYLTYGFSLIGFDSCAYSNNDLERKEVRLELGILLK